MQANNNIQLFIKYGLTLSGQSSEDDGRDVNVLLASALGLSKVKKSWGMGKGCLRFGVLGMEGCR